MLFSRLMLGSLILIPVLAIAGGKEKFDQEPGTVSMSRALCYIVKNNQLSKPAPCLADNFIAAGGRGTKYQINGKYYTYGEALDPNSTAPEGKVIDQMLNLNPASAYSRNHAGKIILKHADMNSRIGPKDLFCMKGSDIEFCTEDIK